MSIKATFYTFIKKTNSTKRPASGGTEYDIEIVENSSLINPNIILRSPAMSDFLGAYNYVHIPTFSRYYFVTNIVYSAVDGFWHYALSVDVLATLKTEILATTQFVERSASHYDLDMIDNLYPTKATPTFETNVVSGYFNATPSSGYYIIGLNSNGLSGNARFGSTSFYLLDSTMMNAFIDYLMGVNDWKESTGTSSWWQNLTPEMTELLGVISDPLQFITTCKFFPRTLITPDNSWKTNIKFGNWTSTVEGYLLPESFTTPAPVIHNGFTIQLAKHPQTVTVGNWVNTNKLTSRVLRFEPFGLIPLDCSKLLAYDYIYCDVATDVITGQGILSIYASPQPVSVPVVLEQMLLLGTYATDILIDIPLTQLRHKGYLQAITDYIVKPTINSGLSMANSFTNSLGGDLMTMGLKGITNAGNNIWSQMQSIEDGVKNFWGSPRSSGTPGSLLCRMNIVLTSVFYQIVEEYIGEFGKPLYEPYPLQNLTGYTKCSGAEFGSSYTASENESVKGFLNSGFIIE